jgi:osmotically-inducible protein OsmY
MQSFKFNPRFTLVAPMAMVLLSGLPMHASDVDKRIESTAKNSFNFKTYLKDDNIKVESSDGVVTLTGTVPFDYHRSLAEETVSGLPGVKSVVNKLSVVGNQPSEHSDGWITMKVKGALTFRRNVSATDTEVSTLNGVVTLTGTAESQAQKDLTGEYTKDVLGVKEVRNEMKVSHQGKSGHRSVGEKVDDASITAQIKTSLLFHKATHVLSTRVATKNGVVTLHGEARNDAELALVTKLVEDIHGVKRVHNKMTVSKS